MNYVRRFVFVHYRDLLTLRLKKLEKVSDRLYVFTPSTVEQVPLHLVRQLQRMGPDLEWIDLGDVGKADAASIVGFHVGVLHESVDLGVEFAVLSDDAALDALVAHVEASGRSCVRVRQQTATRTPDDDDEATLDDDEADELIDLDAEADLGPRLADSKFRGLRAEAVQERRPQPAAKRATGDLRERLGVSLPSVQKNGSGPAQDPQGGDAGERRSPDGAQATVASLSDELVRRLIRSGNRPDDLSMLRSYILLYVEEPGSATHVDDIIAHMADKGEIKLDDGQVQYNF